MAKFTVIGENTKVTFEYTAPTATIQNIVGNASEYLFNHGYGEHGETPILFTSLTNAQKLDLVDAHVKDVIVNLANTWKSKKAQDTVRITEEASKYIL